MGRVPKDTPWRDKKWLQENLDRLGGYDSGTGGASSGAVSALALELGCNQSTISVWARKHRLVPVDRTPPPPLVPIVNADVRIEGDAAVSSDWHLPLMDYDAFWRFLDDAQSHNLTTGICAGDLLNLDAWSVHAPDQENAGISVEREHAKYAVKCALDVFDKFIVTLGNHDQRASRQLNWKVPFDEALRMMLGGLEPAVLDRITVSETDSVTAETDQGEWLICHTNIYSRIPLAYPGRLALRHMQHIAAGHRHHHAQGYAANGKMTVELGGLHDAKRTKYLKRFTNDFPQWSNGYGLLVDGRMHCPMLYS